MTSFIIYYARYSQLITEKKNIITAVSTKLIDDFIKYKFFKITYWQRAALLISLYIYKYIIYVSKDTDLNKKKILFFLLLINKLLFSLQSLYKRYKFDAIRENNLLYIKRNSFIDPIRLRFLL